MDKEQKQQLKIALIGAFGEGMDCLCNASKAEECF